MKHVLIGVTGGIAAYKSAELARIFTNNGADVRVIMTPSAQKFIAPLTFQTLTGNNVYVDLFAGRYDQKVRHIDLLEGIDVLVVAPASANTIGKMAGGLADNLLTTVYLAAVCPVVIIPSMNVNMYKHPAVQSNLDKLQSDGCHIMDPDAGELACGVYGTGRMPDPQDIFYFVRSVIRPKDFEGVNALVTAGPTREYLDPVRFISNPSSGLMGYAMARALSERGAAVTLVSGPVDLPIPAGVKKIAVTTAEQMEKAVKENYEQCRLVIKAAAVSDFRPLKVSEQKVKKDAAALTIELVKNRDILHDLSNMKGSHILVGFAAETENELENARNKLIHKNLDLIVVNNLNEPGSGFASPTNRVSIIDHSGSVEELPQMNKAELAHRILDRIYKII